MSAKFVQITFGASRCGANLYALDEEGRVWTHDMRCSDDVPFEAETHWTALGEARLDPFAKSVALPSSGLTEEPQ